MAQVTEENGRADMRVYLQLFALMVCLAMVSLAQADEPAAPHDLPRIVYIGTNDSPVENPSAASRAAFDLSTYNLDAQRNLENHLAADLPSDMTAAEALVQQRFDDLSTEEVRAIFQAVVLVSQWDIRKVPAFVFGDGEAVIYGLTDVGDALDHWQAWRGRKLP